MNYRLALGALTLLVPIAASAEPAAVETVLPPSPLKLEWCIERARSANPSLERARAAAQAASHRVTPAGALQDPRFTYEASNLPLGDFNFSSTPMSGHQLFLRQKLPFPGMLSNRRAAAEHEAEASGLFVDDHEFVTDGAVEAAWSELGFRQQALAITERNIDLLRQLAATAESRYQVGNGLQQDVLRAQVELTALLQERLQREEAIETAQATLAELLDLRLHTRLPRIAALRLDAPTPTLEPILEALEQRSPRLKAAREQIRAAKARITAIEREGLPDVDVGVGYRIRNDVPGDPVGGDDFFSAGVTIRLPVYRGKWRAKAAEQRSLLRRAQADYAATRAALVSLSRQAHAEVLRATSETELLEDGLVPQARQSLDSSRSAYEVGRIDFLSLLDSQVRLLKAELRLARARADKRVAYASLEAAIGEKLR